MKTDFNRRWTTYTTPQPEEWRLPRETRIVDLPHDDNIRFDTAASNESGPAGAYYPGCSVEYEKTLAMPAEWLQMCVSLVFDGVYHNAVVRVNNQLAARAHYGYTAFKCELSPFLREGDNLLRVSAANKDVPNSRWYTGTGIYRDVELWVQEKVHIPWRGVSLVTVLVGDAANVEAVVRVENHTDMAASRLVRIALRDAQGQTAAKAQAKTVIPANDDVQIPLSLTIPSARLWSDEAPYLYRAEIALMDGGRVADEHSFDYGLRTVAVDTERGLLINGKPVKLRGGCLHHDNGILGAASYASAEERRIRLLKASGFNAIRSSHNPASETLLRACDKYGMLVMDEAFDMWREPKMPYDNSLYFDMTWKNDVAAMVERDRNHACVILYSTGNELPERDGHSEGHRVNRELAEYMRALDSTRPVTSALCNVSPEGVNGIEANLLKDSGQDYFAHVTEGYAAPLDVVGYNYMPDRFEPDRALNKNRVFCATETVGCDIYNGWDKVKRLPYVIGDFVWTAMDYLGEVGVGRALLDEKPWGLAAFPYRLSGCGALDIAGRIKPAGYYRQCVWGVSTRPYLAVEAPAIHDRVKNPSWWGWPIVNEYWSYPGCEGKPTRVSVYSTADEVALYLNGRLIAKAPTDKYIAAFELPYEAGELMAVGLKDSREVNRHAIRTPDGTRRLTLVADKSTLTGGADELLFVDVLLTDEQGNPIIDEERTVTFAVEGEARFFAAGNTAIKTTANYTDPRQRLYEGHAQVVLRTTGSTGKATLYCISEGLPLAVLEVGVVEAD